jgi:uncharacterized protein YbjT (DUF2867 family)
MPDSRIIAIVGATGRQGGGLARAVLTDPSAAFTVRALTRDPASERARALAALGAEVVKADLNDEASLRAAFDGAYGAYVVTDYFSADVPDAPLRSPQGTGQIRAHRELTQALNAARAARDTGLQHVIWSTSEDTRPHFDRTANNIPRTEEGYVTPHLDAKAEANAFFTELRVPTTFLQTAYYYDGLISGALTRDPRGEPALILPLADSRLALICSEDIGRTALTILRHPDDYIGRTVSVAGAHASGEELAAMISGIVGEKVHYRPFTWEQFRSLPFSAAVTAANAFQYFAENEEDLLARRDLEESRRINPQMVPLKSWLRSHRSSILPPAAAS